MAFVGRLIDVAPDGSQQIVTQGWLRASFRHVDPKRSRPGAPYLTDERLEFGAMVLGQGKAFSLNEAETLSGLNVSDDKAVPVGKSWSELAPGRQFLVESVNYWSIRSALELLPAAPNANAAKPSKNTRDRTVAAFRNGSLTP